MNIEARIDSHSTLPARVRGSHKAAGTLDPAIVSALVEERHRFLGFLKKRLRNSHDAEDVLSEFYVRVYEKGWQVKDLERLNYWMYRVLKTVLVDYCRQRTTTHRTEKSWHEDFWQAPKENSKNVICCDCALKHLPCLKPDYENVLRRFYFLGQSSEEIARFSDTTSGNVRVRLHRSRNAFRKILEQAQPKCSKKGDTCFEGECFTKLIKRISMQDAQ